jgi:ATP-dependent DNA helicase DinG
MHPTHETPDADAREPLPATVGAIFTDGILSRTLRGYEPRDGQRRMAEAVASVIEESGTLLTEAGTGTGKTLAYLVPAILSGHRVLVSTGTKNLQEQICFKDIPALRDALDLPFTATLMKGRGNYLCLHRLAQIEDSGGSSLFGDAEDPARAVFLPVIQDWAARTDTGDRAELSELPEDLPLWREIAAEADACLGADCPRYDDCFLTRMRRRAAESDVVIVNHHLLCADASVRHGAFGEVIPSSPVLVVDEAHQLEDVVTQYFGVAASQPRIEDLARDGEHLLATWALEEPRRVEIARALGRVGDLAGVFFAALLAARTGASEPRQRYTSESMAGIADEGDLLVGALERLETALATAAPGTQEANEAADAVLRRARELRSELRFLLRADDPDFVYYVEPRGRGLVLRASPIDVSRIVGEALFDRFRTVILTSATLAVDGSFDYVRGRLGLRHADELRVPSEFDYARQALLYLPRRMPPPRAPDFAEAVAREAGALLARSRGRAFVLFTSYRVLHAVRPFLEMSLTYPTLVQGTAPRSALIERFRSTPGAVLLATASFWQGVDVVGDALSCVVIDKLPFASPGDPVTAARIDAITARGGDAFGEYQVPLAILALQQGLGRLIRHRGDRGVLAILDPRLRTMGYGRRFLASLPPAPVTHDLEAVDRFFQVD